MDFAPTTEEELRLRLRLSVVLHTKSLEPLADEAAGGRAGCLLRVLPLFHSWTMGPLTYSVRYDIRLRFRAGAPFSCGLGAYRAKKGPVDVLIFGQDDATGGECLAEEERQKAYKARGTKEPGRDLTALSGSQVARLGPKEDEVCTPRRGWGPHGITGEVGGCRGISAVDE